VFLAPLMLSPKSEAFLVVLFSLPLSDRLSSLSLLRLGVASPYSEFSMTPFPSKPFRVPTIFVPFSAFFFTTARIRHECVASQLSTSL